MHSSKTRIIINWRSLNRLHTQVCHFKSNTANWVPTSTSHRRAVTVALHCKLCFIFCLSTVSYGRFETSITVTMADLRLALPLLWHNIEPTMFKFKVKCSTTDTKKKRISRNQSRHLSKQKTQLSYAHFDQCYA